VTRWQQIHACFCCVCQELDLLLHGVAAWHPASRHVSPYAFKCMLVDHT
jgi:hypothetical protein